MVSWTRCDALPYRVCSDPTSLELYGATTDALIVSVADYPPYSYESPPGSLCFCGLTISLLSHISGLLDLKFVLVPERSPLFNTSKDGPPFDISNQRANVSVCPLGITPARLADWDLVSVYTVRTYQVAIHKSLLIEGGTESLLHGIADSFDEYSWIGITAVSLWILVIFWASNVLLFRLQRRPDQLHSPSVWKAFGKTYWEVFYSVISQADIIRSKYVAAYNIVVLVWLSWALIIFYTIITASLAATLSINPTTLPFDSPESFLQSDYILVSRPMDSFQRDAVQKFTSKVVIHETNNSDAYLYDLAADTSRQKVAVTCIFVDSSGCSDRGLVPAFDLGIKRWVSLIQMRKNTSIVPGFNSSI
ncbi:uncharacterized protein LOC129600103 isoform X2 [Paramacrobiotus metropolitanus]|uniref:uncharacterized protein LOC129600103 isoform X2 n=1 Tax=Paramacrobiotus metropolitanus TaxID=2943436 RepID=UPI002445E84D|nr:uncharacterized protein LOC129600103 isoform X2 [Paramacrobiotus metropolitanus]